jgi:hypothetical protein
MNATRAAGGLSANAAAIKAGFRPAPIAVPAEVVDLNRFATAAAPSRRTFDPWQVAKQTVVIYKVKRALHQGDMN